MSDPAREVIEPSHPVTSLAPRPSRPASARPRSAPSRTATARPRGSRHSRPRTRRPFHPAFWIMTAVVVTGMVVGLASLSAMLVQTTFRVEELEGTIATQRDAHETLTEEVASRSSPSRIAAWALGRGMVMPDDVVVVQVPGGLGDTGEAPGATAGETAGETG